MALPALHPGIYVAPSLDALGSDFRLGRNGDWGSRLFIRPARREVLDPGYEVGALLFGEGAPLRHIGTVESASDGVEQILVGGESSGGSRATLENAELEVAGLGVYPRETFTIAVSKRAVAYDAVAAIIALGIPGMAGNISDVGFHAQARVKVVLCKLRPGWQLEG